MTDKKNIEVEAKETEGKKFEVPKIVGYIVAGIAGAVAIAIGGIGLKGILDKSYVGLDDEDESEEDSED